MSDLNQAIREHLALKRQHGADPAEVERLELEALGEVSRASARDQIDDRASYAQLAEYPVVREDETLLREEIVPPTNEYAPAHASAYREVGEETQEFRVDDQIGWVGGPAWHGGAA
ncbi:MAG TPA: hypothetical protein VHM72_04430 [Solirubrobacteraceae bacterium]|jgi:arginine deiminase|nr:hypothetical protein [Solirubrobacteraceae bacterium]